MLHLSDGRDHGYMWDTGRKLKCDAGLRDGTTVFFMLPGRYDPIPMAVENGTVPVPDEAWHKEGKFIVFLYAMDSTGRYTRTSRTFTVKSAPKPNNYAYTPTEVLDWHTLEARIEELEGEGLAKAVAAYLQENPVEAGATAEEAAQIEQNKTDIATLGRTKLAASELPNAVNEALAQAKASGAFNGKDGKDGDDGYTPQKNVDYFDGKDGDNYVLTEADKQEIAQEAAGMVDVPDVDIPTALPNPNALTFTGAATGTYDGSAPLTVNIPEGGGSTGGGSSGTWELIGEVTSDGAGTNTGISIPCDISGYKSVFVYAQNLPGETNFRIVMRTTLTWTQAACFFGYNLLGKQGSFTFGAQFGKMNNPWSITGLAYNVANHIFSYGAAESQYNGGTAPWRQSEQSNKLPTENWANVKYISLDRNSSTDIVPEGCILRAWGCK